MFEVSLIKLPSRNCLQVNITGTYWKYIQHWFRCTKWPAGVYTILSCNRTVIVDPSAIGRQSVGDQLGSNRQPIGDRSANGWRLYLERLFSMQKLCNFLEIGRQPIGDWSAISRRLKNVLGLSATAATGRRSVGDLSATTKKLSTIDLAAERFHLQQPKPPCDQIVPATFCNRSATSRRPPCNHPATSLRPPEILVARRSPTGWKLCVTGALTVDIYMGKLSIGLGFMTPGLFCCNRLTKTTMIVINKTPQSDMQDSLCPITNVCNNVKWGKGTSNVLVRYDLSLSNDMAHWDISKACHTPRHTTGVTDIWVCALLFERRTYARSTSNDEIILNAEGLILIWFGLFSTVKA